MTAKPPTDDLSDADIDELDQLLAEVPAPWEALDVVMLDGYLCGLLAQPVDIPPPQWHAPLFGDVDKPLAPDSPGWDAARHERLLALVDRRLAHLRQSILEEGWFDPIVPAPLDEAGQPLHGKDAMQVLGFWVAGFEWALANFTALEDRGLPDVPDLLDSIWRHLPDQDDTQQAMTQALDEEHPLKSLDEAVEALVFDVVDLVQIAVKEKLKVSTVRHEQPRPGRNDPCPCGSGRKYKHCHGA